MRHTLRISSGTSVDLREFVHIFAPHTLDVKFYPRSKHLQVPSQNTIAFCFTHHYDALASVAANSLLKDLGMLGSPPISLCFVATCQL